VKTIIRIEGMTCGHCVARVEKALKALPGAEGVKVDLKKNQAEVKAISANDDTIKAAVTEAGYTVTSITQAQAGFSLFRAGMVFLVVGTAFSLVSCESTDVVGRVAATSFDAVIAKLGDKAGMSGMDPAWQIASPAGDLFLIAQDFSRPNKDGESPDFEMDFDAKPFVAAGLDVNKLPMSDAVGYRLEDGRFMLHFEWGDAPLKAATGGKDITATFRQILATYRDRIGYHEKLDHFGFALGDGNMVEWAKDLATNDKDLVFVLNPEPLMQAGLDPNKVEGWVYAKVEVKDANGKAQLVDKLLKPFNL
jgi:copper chaperone CopZ